MESPLQNTDAGADRQRETLDLPRDRGAPQWFAAYTVPNHEKRVARQLADRAIPHYLPLYQSVRQWKDRKMRLDLPLFPGYVFVEIALRDRLKVIQVPSLVRLVGFGGQPAALPESDVTAIRMCLEHKWGIEPHPVISTGQRVRIVRGALAGIEGILVRKKGVSRLVLCVSLIMRAVAIEVDDVDVAPIYYSASTHASAHGSARKN
jgi:transcription antitermination factor NusG